MGGRDEEMVVDEEEEGGCQCMNDRCMSWWFAVVQTQSAECELEV